MSSARRAEVVSGGRCEGMSERRRSVWVCEGRREAAGRYGRVGGG